MSNLFFANNDEITRSCMISMTVSMRWVGWGGELGIVKYKKLLKENKKLYDNLND